MVKAGRGGSEVEGRMKDKPPAIVILLVAAAVFGVSLAIQLNFAGLDPTH